VTTLGKLQKAVIDALKTHHELNGLAVPVIAEDEGNLVAEREAAVAKSYICDTVGAAEFTPTSNGSIIVGNARLVVTVWERPTRNRVGQPGGGHNATDEAETVALALNLMPFDGGVLVFKGIGGVVRNDGETISRAVAFETVATLGDGVAPGMA